MYETSSPNRPSRDPHYFGFSFSRNMLSSVPKKYRTRNSRFFKKNFGVNITVKNWKSNFLNHGRNDRRLWFGSYEKIKIKIKIKKNKKTKIIKYDGS